MKNRAEWTAWAEKRKARVEAARSFSAEPELKAQTTLVAVAQDAHGTEYRAPTYRPEATIPAKRFASVNGRLYPLVQLCIAHGLPQPIPEYQFAPPRLWRADYCWPIPLGIIVEIDGGVYTQGRHTRGTGFIEDQRKLNAAAVLGYRVIRVTPDRLGEAVECVKEIINQKP